ncbi:lytic transglycosylase domain-containing protein [Rickettsia endosymbiont of Culicoides newsteadi]|uniref:lytic transglycosylase domain-containing protein n=1 Tax=Rickettsia endosymbiont of Culicoides newsteadi TaxID=1961830 RepID=UPI000BD5C00D|nr:lytic transglycosylase domain-containing protein [Rickettsia endosymbiont of Culicoides newsteadi]OZG32436.1 lytic transglycosylase [Rickettsia endosymbiont of Culicoides newsteadi]
MKYSIGHNRPMAVYIVIESLKAGKLLCKPKNNCTETGTVITSTKPKPVGYLLFNGSPCLFTKILSAVYVTLLALASKYGANETVKMMNSKAKIGTKLLKKSDKAALEVMPSQNIKFQKLSRVQRDLNQFIQSLILKVISLSLLWLQLICQAKFTMITIFLLSISVSVHADSQIANLIKTIEYQYAIPSGLLLALANVESNYQPYSLNISGKSVISNSVEQAKNIAEQYLQKGKQNIDIGVMQLNYFWHGKNFTSIAEMLTPKKNIHYAAQLLTGLYKQHGSWHKAVRYYHSRNPKYHRQYSRKVLVAWLKSDRQINSR